MDVDDVDVAEEIKKLGSMDNSTAAAAALQAIIDAPAEGAQQIKRTELAIVEVSRIYSENGRTEDLKKLITSIRPFMTNISKAKGGKLFRLVLDRFLAIGDAQLVQVAVLNECIEWTKTGKRRFLRQSLEVMQASLHLKAKQYQECLAVSQPLVRELKRLDDKLQLVEVQLMESQAYYALSNYPRSRAALVSARTTANGVYCPPKLQAALDLQSGITHAQEHDFATSYSYFYEAFEGFDGTDLAKQAVSGLKYMLLCKIMMKRADDVPSIISGKTALKYSTGSDSSALDAMRAVATANLNRSLAEFEKALEDFKEELSDDVIIQSHVSEMYDTMLQNNLCRIVEPYSSIEIDHVAKLIKLDREVVENKLSQMILDKNLLGILDQGAGCLEIFEESNDDAAYAEAIDAIKNTGQVVEALYIKTQKLF